MQRVIVLGGGMVGSTIGADLSGEYDVTIADKNVQQLQRLESLYNVKTKIIDIIRTDIADFLKEFDLVIGAFPGHIGFESLKAIISAGKNVVEISFFDRDPFELDELAKMMNVTAVVDCGISPGLSNIILGFHNERMKIDSYKCYVGGLPFKKTWPYEYKAFFSPIDVIQEYVRPARLFKDGKMIIEDALSDQELIEVEGIGTFEAFNTDGLRTLLKTMKIPNMVEKTIRYTGHSNLMKIFRETGFFSEEKTKVNGTTIRPIDLTTKLLFPFWQPEKNEEEFTFLKIKISGKEENVRKEIIYEIFDKFDHKTNTTSMARTTGYTCTSVARLVLEGKLKNKGICPPEYVGAIPGYYDKILNMLKQKNINIKKTEKLI